MSETAGPVWEFEGLAPSGVTKRVFRLPKSRIIKHFHETGNERMFREAALVPDVVASPAAIFLGLARSGQEEALCYTGVPSGEFASNNGLEAVSVPKGYTFMVFATKDFEVAKWRLCEEAPERPGFPIDHETRFGRRLWPQD